MFIVFRYCIVRHRGIRRFTIHITKGRSALITAFDTFKYMILYSFIQFSGVLILYSIESYYSNFEFLYADLFLNFQLVIAIIQPRANPELASKRPNGRLVHPVFILGILLQIMVMFLFNSLYFFTLKECLGMYHTSTK